MNSVPGTATPTIDALSLVTVTVRPPAPAGAPSVTSSVVERPTPTRSSPAMSSAMVVTGAVTVMVTTTVSGATSGRNEATSTIARYVPTERNAGRGSSVIVAGTFPSEVMKSQPLSPAP